MREHRNARPQLSCSSLGLLEGRNGAVRGARDAVKPSGLGHLWRRYVGPQASLVMTKTAVDAHFDVLSRAPGARTRTGPLLVHGRREVAKVTAQVTERAAVGALLVYCLLQRRMLFRSYSALSQAFRQALGGLETFRNVEMDSDNFHRNPESNAKRRRQSPGTENLKRARGARAAAERPHCRTGRATVILSNHKTQRVSVALPRRQIFLRLPENTALLKESFARLETDVGPPSSTDLARCGSRELLEGSAAILKAEAVQRSGKDQRQRISLAIFCELACSGVPDGAKNATLASDLP